MTNPLDRHRAVREQLAAEMRKQPRTDNQGTVLPFAKQPTAVQANLWRNGVTRAVAARVGQDMAEELLTDDGFLSRLDGVANLSPDLPDFGALVDLAVADYTGFSGDAA